VLKDAETNEGSWGKMKVSALLEALPKVGKVKAQEIIDRAGDRPDAPVCAASATVSARLCWKSFDFA